MSENQERLQSLQPMHELATGLAAEMGETPEKRVNWLLNQDADSFGEVLVSVNAVARGLATEQHRFDGEGVQAGTIGGSIPPDQEDKIVLLDELLQDSQEKARQQIENGEDPQTIMHEVAMAVPTVINKLHLFGDGNGRTSRFMRMVLRDGDQLTPEKTEVLISKSGTGKYDTTPDLPVERALLPVMRTENDTNDIGLVKDIFDEDEVVFVEDEIQALKDQYPTLDRKIVGAYVDTFNFSETMRLLAKSSGKEAEVSLKQMIDELADSTEAQEQFLQVYRGVRRQRVELLIDGLLGKKDISLIEATKEKDVSISTDYARQKKGQPVLDPSQIDTIQDFQMAYVEAFSPER
jgi:hypothetical protein